MAPTDVNRRPPTGPSPIEECHEQIKEIGGSICAQNHCEEAMRMTHAVCFCEPPYLNGCMKPGSVRPECCSYEPSTPVYVVGPEPCYCCCAEAGADMRVAIDETTARPAFDLGLGDQVWVANDAELSGWGPAAVQFSAGIGAGGAVDLIRVRWGDPERAEVLHVTRDQLFLVPGGRLKRAGSLSAGDSLVRPDGEATPIVDLEATDGGRGIHHVATATAPGGGLGGHLLAVNGVVVADYSLQVSNLERDEPGLLAADEEG